MFRHTGLRKKGAWAARAFSPPVSWNPAGRESCHRPVRRPFDPGRARTGIARTAARTRPVEIVALVAAAFSFRGDGGPENRGCPGQCDPACLSGWYGRLVRRTGADRPALMTVRIVGRLRGKGGELSDAVVGSRRESARAVSDGSLRRQEHSVGQKLAARCRRMRAGYSEFWQKKLLWYYTLFF